MREDFCLLNTSVTYVFFIENLNLLNFTFTGFSKN